MKAHLTQWRLPLFDASIESYFNPEKKIGLLLSLSLDPELDPDPYSPKGMDPDQDVHIRYSNECRAVYITGTCPW
jgi:hypothetical protein